MAELTHATPDGIREAVRERYAAAAGRLPQAGSACCGPSSSPLGCGNPTAVARAEVEDDLPLLQIGDRRPARGAPSGTGGQGLRARHDR
jgi:hypothetical protein